VWCSETSGGTHRSTPKVSECLVRHGYHSCFIHIWDQTYHTYRSILGETWDLRGGQPLYHVETEVL
jgi:hypothetical protein